MMGPAALEMREDDIVDAKIAAAEARADAKFASEARTDAKFAEFSGKLDKVLTAVQAVDSRVAGIETKMAEQRADLDKRLSDQRSDLDRRLSEQRTDFKADFRADRALTIGATLSLAGLMIALVVAIFGVGGTMFSRGMQIRDVVKAVIAEQQSRPPPQKP